MACKLKVFSVISDLKSVCSSLGLANQYESDSGSKNPTDDEIDGWNNNCVTSSEEYSFQSSWPQCCLMSLSSFADSLVVCNSKKAVFLKSKWESIDNNLERLNFSISAERTLVQFEGEKICSVLCLPLASQRKSHQSGPDWTCIIVGFSTGIVRIYTEEGELLLSQPILDVPVHRLSYRISSTEEIGDLVAVGTSTVAIIEGFVLWQTLKACRNHLARAKAGEGDKMQMESLVFKRWNLPDSKGISDCCIIGHATMSAFDYLVSESIREGPSAYPKSSLPGLNLLLTTGENLFLGFYHITDCREQQALSDVAVAFANKIKTMLIPPVGNRLINGIFGRNEPNEPQNNPVEPPILVNVRFGLFDKHRQGSTLYLTPNSKLAALTDTFGRVILVDVQKGICIRMFKGYREAQCGWIQEESNSCKVFYLVIYAPKRGILEIWLAQLGHRVAAFNVSKFARLLYSGGGVLGFNRSLHHRSNLQTSSSSDIFPCCLLEPNGNILIISLTFKSALLENSNPEELDAQLLKELKECLKIRSSDDLVNRINDVKHLLRKISSCRTLKKSLLLLVENTFLSAELILDLVSTLTSHLSSFDETNDKLLLIEYCRKVCLLTRTFASFYLLNTRMDFQEDSNLAADIDVLSTSLKVNPSEVEQLLAIISIENEREISKKQKRVSFAEEEHFSCVAHFLKDFQIFGENEHEKFIKCKTTCNEEQKINLGTFLFQVSLKTEDMLEESQQILKDSEIDPFNLILLLLHHWLKLGKNFPHWSKWVNLHKALKFCSDLISTPLIELDSIKELLSNSCNLRAAYLACNLIKGIHNSANKESQENWEDLSSEDIAFNILSKRLEDLILLNALIKTKVISSSAITVTTQLSLAEIQRKGNGAISEVVAEWAVLNHLTPQFFIENEHDGFEKVKGIFDECCNRFPRSLDMDAILSNVCWEEMVRWKKEADDVQHLTQALEHLKNIKSNVLRNGIGSMMWKTFILPRFEALTLLMEKVGKTPKERLCKQEMTMSAIHLESFLEFCSYFLDLLIETSCNCETEEPLTPFPPDDLWRSKESRNAAPPLVVLACNLGPSNYSTIYHHYLLANAMLFVVAFTMKNSRPLSLYDARGRQAFFRDFQSESNFPLASLSHSLIVARIQFLQKVSSAIAISIPDTLPPSTISKNSLSTTPSICDAPTDSSKWINRVLNLAKGWDLPRNDIAQYYVCQLYSLGHDQLAQEAMTSVVNSSKLGSQLLLIAGQRIAHLVNASCDQAATLAYLTPILSTWLKKMDLSQLGHCQTSLMDTKMLIGHSLDLIPENESDHKMAVSLLDAVITLMK